MPHDNHTQHAHSNASTPKSTQKEQSQVSSSPSTPLVLQRAYEDPSSLTATDVKQLQRTVGNQAVVGLLSKSTGLQAKLNLGPAGDKYEKEADHVAQQVVHSTQTPSTQRESVDEEELQMKPLAAEVTPIQRKSAQKPTVQQTLRGQNGVQRKEGTSSQPITFHTRNANQEPIQRVSIGTATKPAPTKQWEVMGGFSSKHLVDGALTAEKAKDKWKERWSKPSTRAPKNTVVSKEDLKTAIEAGQVSGTYPAPRGPRKTLTVKLKGFTVKRKYGTDDPGAATELTQIGVEGTASESLFFPDHLDPETSV